MEALADLALKKLKECKASLGDIGDAPLGLLEPVLVACDAEGLDRIETSTARGHSGRDLSEDTWPLWYRFVKESMKATLKKNEILKGIDRRKYVTLGGDARKVNELTPLRHLVSASVPPLDYKRLYKDIEKRKKERLVKKGEALRAKFRDLKEEKLSRCVHVLDHASSRIAKHAASLSRGKKRKQASVSSSSASTRTCMNQDVLKSNRQGTMHRLSQKLGIRPPPASKTAHEQFLQRAQKRSMIRRHCQPKKVLPTAGQLRSPSSTRDQTANSKQSGNRKHTLSSASIFDS
jgi:hypothetical protein